MEKKLINGVPTEKDIKLAEGVSEIYCAALNYAEVKHPFIWPINKFGELIEQRVGQNAPGSRKHLKEQQKIIDAYIAGAKWAANDAAYWKQRCEAAEEVIEVERTRASAERIGKRDEIESAYKIWQSLKQKQL